MSLHRTGYCSVAPGAPFFFREEYFQKCPISNPNSRPKVSRSSSATRSPRRRRGRRRLQANPIPGSRGSLFCGQAQHRTFCASEHGPGERSSRLPVRLTLEHTFASEGPPWGYTSLKASSDRRLQSTGGRIIGNYRLRAPEANGAVSWAGALSCNLFRMSFSM